jgi:hypothetical protein
MSTSLSGNGFYQGDRGERHARRASRALATRKPARSIRVDNGRGVALSGFALTTGTHCAMGFR